MGTYPSYDNGFFSPLLVQRVCCQRGRSLSVLYEQYEASYLFYVTLSFLCNVICYLISVFVFSLVTLSGATTISKALTPHQPNPMTIIKKMGSRITTTHKGNQTTRNSSLFKKIPKPTTNPTHNLMKYSSFEDESHTQSTTPPKPKDNQAQHTTLNLRRSGRTRQPPKRFDY